jgi:hypothetical protein
MSRVSFGGLGQLPAHVRVPSLADPVNAFVTIAADRDQLEGQFVKGMIVYHVMHFRRRSLQTPLTEAAVPRQYLGP